MTMRAVASIWRYELKRQNAQEIAGPAGDLCDNVSASLIDLNPCRENTEALNSHYEAVKRLPTEKGNALYIAERIRSLAVKTKRPMSSMPVDGVLVIAPTEDSEDIWSRSVLSNHSKGGVVQVLKKAALF